MTRRRAGLARRASLALCLLCGFVSGGAAADENAALTLRYGWAPGQTWRSTYSVSRETRLAGDVQRERGVAHFEYRVLADEQPGELRLEVRLLSQETAAGVSPLDFSAILFHTGIDARGRLRDPRFDIARSEPPDVPGVVPDPVEYQHMLQQVAAAWRDAAFWFPELPDRSLAPGKAFAVEEERDLGDVQSGMAMRVRSARNYRLLSVAGGVARFRVEEDSHVDAATGESGIASRQQAEGEALFDLALGMWTRHELVSSQRASYSGAPTGVGTGEATSQSVTTIEMQRTSAGAR